jgi:lauroyl/myristoyl acyltransferase
MINLFYETLMRCSQRWGIWIFYMASWMVASGYFFLFPVRVNISVRFYRALFPHRSPFYHILCAWRQFHRFTHVYIDRYLLRHSTRITFTTDGWQHIETAVKEKKGAVLLMSHIGNWEIAAHLLREQSIPLLLFMGKKNKEQIEATQKATLKKHGIQIIAVDQEADSPVEILEAIRFLRQGGLISMTGDRTWSLKQKTVKTTFLNHEITIPEAPHAIAMLTGAPLLVFFSFRTGLHKYHVVLNPPIYLNKTCSRHDRKQIIDFSAGEYARMMETAVSRYPLEWYHFERFLGPAIHRTSIAREQNRRGAL